MTQEELEEEKVKHLKIHKLLHNEMSKAHEVYLSKLSELDKNMEKFKAVDYELAMLNRTILPPQGERKKKVTKPQKFTQEEIKKIASRLGVKLDYLRAE